MSPEDLARRHPFLYHVTEAGAHQSILRHGLLPTSSLLSLFEIPAADRPAIERRRRPRSVPLVHPVHGRATISDNSPLSEAALVACLDDRLKPEDWLRLLNGRVFFWAEEGDASRLLGARRNSGRDKEVLVLDTLSLAHRYRRRIELSPINSGASLRRPAHRGLTTFTALEIHSYAAWSRLRGKRDRVREVTVVGDVCDIADHLIEVRRVAGRDGPPAAKPPQFKSQA